MTIDTLIRNMLLGFAFVLIVFFLAWAWSERDLEINGPVQAMGALK